MAKAPKMKKGKQLEEPHGIKPPKKKKIVHKTRKLQENFQSKKGKSLARYSHKKGDIHTPTNTPRKPKGKPQNLTPEERKKIRSDAAKEYWRKLRENDPEKYAERIRKLQEGRRRKQQEKIKQAKEKTKTPKINENIPKPKIQEIEPETQTPEIETPSNDDGEQIPLDLEETPDENGFYINPETGEVFDNYKEWQESLSNPPSYDPFKPEEDEGLLWDDLVLSNFLLDVYARPTLNGSRFILNWIDTLIDEYGKSMVSAMIEFAKQEGYEIDVKLLYEEDKSSAMASGFMQFWYSKGFFADDESIQNRYDPMKKIRGKMDKEFQQSQYTFGTSLMKAIEDDINADEVMQNYG